MASVHYDGEKVGIGVEKVRSIAEDLNTYSNDIYEATKTIVCAKGFDFYVGGITANTFSDAIQTFSSGVNDLIRGIREEQIRILQFSQNKDDIKVFLKSLTEEEQKMYDLEEIERLKDRSSNIFKRIGSTIASAGLGLVEGIGDFLETGADLIVMAGCGVASIFTAGLDFFTGRHGDDSVTKRLWDWCKGYVADKKVETCFNKFYSNTEIGRQIKANAYGFDTVRSVSKGIGYTAGMIGLTVLTGGLAAGGGAAIGAAGTVSSTNLALTAGVLGFSNGTEEAWADGADLLDGFKYGLASGAWEGTQWYLGAKINQVGGVGDQVAKTFFNGAKGAATRVALDTVDSAAEGFVQPALKMLYKYDDSKSWSENYKQQFEEAGGWDNVKTQAIMGGTMSAISEAGDLRKLLKENNSGAALEGEIVGGTAAATSTLAALDNSKIGAIGITTVEVNGKTIDVDILPKDAKLNSSNMKVIDAEVVTAKNVNTSKVTKNVDVNLKNVDTGSVIKNTDVSAKSLSVVTPKVIEGEVVAKNVNVTKNVDTSVPVKYTKNIDANVKPVTSVSTGIKNTNTAVAVKNVDVGNAVVAKNVDNSVVKAASSGAFTKRTITGATTSSVPAVYTKNADATPIIHTKESVRTTVKDGIQTSITSGAKRVDTSTIIEDITESVLNSGNDSSNNNRMVTSMIGTGKNITTDIAARSIKNDVISKNAVNSNIVSSKALATSVSNKDIISSKNLTNTLGTVGTTASLIPAVNLKSIDTNIDGNIAKNITSTMDNNLSKNVSVKSIGGNVDLDISTKGVSLKNTDVNLKNVDSNVSTKNIDVNVKNSDVNFSAKDVQADINKIDVDANVKNVDVKVKDIDTSVKNADVKVKDIDTSVKTEVEVKNVSIDEPKVVKSVETKGFIDDTPPKNIEAKGFIDDTPTKSDLSSGFKENSSNKSEYVSSFKEDVQVKETQPYKSLGGTLLDDVDSTEGMNSTVASNIEKAKASREASARWDEYKHKDVGDVLLETHDKNSPLYGKFSERDLRDYFKDGKVPDGYKSTILGYDYSNAEKDFVAAIHDDGPFAGKFDGKDVRYFEEKGKLPPSFESVVEDFMTDDPIRKDLADAEWGGKFHDKFTTEQINNYKKFGEIPENYESVIKDYEYNKQVSHDLANARFGDGRMAGKITDAEIDAYYKNGTIPKDYDKLVREYEYKSQVSRDLVSAGYDEGRMAGKFTNAELDDYYKNGTIPKDYDKIAAELDSKKSISSSNKADIEISKSEFEMGKDSDIKVEKTRKSKFADPALREPETKSLSEVALEEKAKLQESGGRKNRFADPALREPETKSLSEVALEEKAKLQESGGKKNRFADPSLYESENKISNLASTDVSKNIDSKLDVDVNTKTAEVKPEIEVSKPEVEVSTKSVETKPEVEVVAKSVETKPEVETNVEIDKPEVEVSKPEVEVVAKSVETKPEVEINDEVDTYTSSSGIGGKSGADQKVEMAQMYRQNFPGATDVQIKERIDGIFDGSVAMTKSEANVMQEFISRYSTDSLEAREIFNDNFVKNSDGTYSYRTSSTPSYNAPSYTSKHFNDYDDLISSIDDPLSTENVKKIVELFDDKSTAGYDDIVTLNSKGAKLEPDVSVERDFLNKFTEDNGYRIHKQHEYFLHVIDENNYDYDVTTRIYLNVSDYTDAYKFGMEFADECHNEGMGFYFKTGRSENGKFMSDFTQYRDEAVVIYCSQDQVANYTNIVNKVLKKTGIELDDPPILTGRVAGTNIGIGAEPTMLEERASFNGVRTKAIQDAYKYTKATYNERAIIKNSPEYYEYFKKVLADRGKKWYIDPDNFALEKAA